MSWIGAICLSLLCLATAKLAQRFTSNIWLIYASVIFVACLRFYTHSYGAAPEPWFLSFFTIHHDILCPVALAMACATFDEWWVDGKKKSFYFCLIWYVVAICIKESGFIFPVMAMALCLRPGVHNTRSACKIIGFLVALNCAFFELHRIFVGSHNAGEHLIVDKSIVIWLRCFCAPVFIPADEGRFVFLGLSILLGITVCTLLNKYRDLQWSKATIAVLIIAAAIFGSLKILCAVLIAYWLFRKASIELSLIVAWILVAVACMIGMVLPEWWDTMSAVPFRAVAWVALITSVAPSIDMPGSSERQKGLSALGLTAFSVVEFALTLKLHSNIPTSIAYSAYIVHNHLGAYAPINASRVLGPALMYLSAYANHISLPICGTIIAAIALTLANAAIFVAAKHRQISPVLSLTCFAAVLLLFNYETSSIFDWIGLLTMTCFMIAICFNVNIWIFAAIFAVQLFNRESALYIPLWIVLSSVGVSKGIQINISRLLIGLGLFLFGSIAIELLRAGAIGNPISHMYATQSHMWIRNETLLGDDNWNERYVVIGLIIWLMLAWALLRDHMENWGATGFTIAAMIAAQLVFSQICELRVWWDLLPFAIMPVLMMTDLFQNLAQRCNQMLKCDKFENYHHFDFCTKWQREIEMSGGYDTTTELSAEELSEKHVRRNESPRTQ